MADTAADKALLLYLLLLLIPPLLWFGLAYIGSLAALVRQSAFTFNDFTMQMSRDLTLANYKALLGGANLDIVIRTAAMAAAVTVASALIGFPIAYYMARYTRGTLRGLFYVGVMLPMWASYIVKAYAWTMLIVIPASIVTVPMVMAKGTMDVSLGLGVLTSADTGAFVKKILSSFELFGLWQVWLSAVAVSVIAETPIRKALWSVFAAWFVWVLIQGGLATLGLNFGM